MSEMCSIVYKKVMFTEEEKKKRKCCDFSPSTLSRVIYLIITEGPLWMISRRHWEARLKAISFALLMLCVNALLASRMCTRTHTCTSKRAHEPI